MKKVSEDELEGLIFDCDGTLVDTMPAYYESWKRLCAVFDLRLSEEKFYSLAGVPVDEIASIVIKDSGKEGLLNVADLMKEKAKYGKESLKKVGQPAIECVVDIVKRYHGKKPMAVASSGLRSHVMESLRAHDLEKYFDYIICGEDVKNGKPAPDIFLLAAKKMKVNPLNCRGFEDGGVGLQSLEAAGMEVVDVKLMDGYPRGSKQKMRNDSSIYDVIRGWIIPILIAVVVIKFGERLLIEAIIDEALSAD